MKSQDFIRVRLYQNVLGMIDGLAAHRIDHRALAYAMNVRVEDAELVTCPGRTKVNSSAVASASINGLAAGQRTDGVNQIIVACDGSDWTVSGNTKTRINVIAGRGSIVTVVSATGMVSGSTDCRFLLDLSAGDCLMLGAAKDQALVVTTVSTDGVAYVSTTPTATTGAYDIRKTRATERTRIRMHMGRWIFGGKTQPFAEYEAVSGTYRELGQYEASACTLTAVSGGSLDASKVYRYQICEQDGLGVYGLPCSAVSGTTTSANMAFTLTFPRYRHTTQYWRIYRSEGGSEPLYHLDTVNVSAATWKDTAADSTLGTESPPTENYKPAAGCDDFIFHKDRMIVQDGSQIRIGGLSVYDEHSGLFAGRWQPWYQPGRTMYLGRDQGAHKDGKGLFVLKGRLFALQSDSLWMIRSEEMEPDVWEAVCMYPNMGCESQWSVWVDGDFAYWLGRRAGRLTVLQFDGLNVIDIGREVQTTVDSITCTSACIGGGGGGIYRLSLVGTTAVELERKLDNGMGRGTWCLRGWMHTCYAESVSASYGGGSTGFVYQLENGLSNAGAAQTYEIRYPKVRDDGEQKLDEYPKQWFYMQTEIENVSGVSGLSATYSVDGGSYNGLSACGYPVSAVNGTVTLKRMRLPTKAQGRDIQIKLALAGTAVKARFRGIILKGKPDLRESI